MNIGIVGLGLIGGSIAKALSQNTDHTVLGMDIEKSVIFKAKLIEAIHDELTDENIGECDFVIVALYPEATVKFVKNHAALFKKEAIVMDTCGVKQIVCEPLMRTAKEHGFVFIGAHPMAGTANFGFEASTNTMFRYASMILTPDEDTPIQTLDKVHNLCLEMGFSRTPVLSAADHDRMIAYTSQLAHVVSSAYIRDPLALKHKGYSAGSFRDMTRVAKLNPDMWTELFFENREFLTEQIDNLITRLSEYSKALKNDDPDTMHNLLKEGTDYKLASTESEKNR